LTDDPVFGFTITNLGASLLLADVAPAATVALIDAGPSLTLKDLP